MGDFKGAFKEGLGESLAYGTAALIFLFLIGLLIGVGVYNSTVDLETLIGRGITKFSKLRYGSRV
jgi:hypothetical protein